MNKNTTDKNSINDPVIRLHLKKYLKKMHSGKKVRLIEELGIHNGDGRVDIATINGIMHGYEIKSDNDTLLRLPKQAEIFNSVFDKITLVVGKKHLFNSIKIIPDWWGIMLVKTNKEGKAVFIQIREASNNMNLDSMSLARLLWKGEALRILEKKGDAKGYYSKPKNSIYCKLLSSIDQKTLKKQVLDTIYFRTDWRSEPQRLLSGG